MKTITTVVLVTLCFMPIAFCQTETATISGRVTDASGAAISGAEVQVQNVLTGREVMTKANSSGLYVVTALQPGTYRVIVSSPGFKQIVKPDVTLNVQDNASLNFGMTVGSASETVTVEGGAPLVNTQDATVSTVVDRQFAENLPMNGRSFQTLIELTPGVVLTTSNGLDSGQFSISGQRTSANYWMVDGVSANIGVNANFEPGSGFAGSVAGFTAQGGTNSLVSVDALQEFRVQTSTYAPEFGRVPGGQISIVTRSGTNQFHGTLFDYLRNDVLDANDWFNGFTNNPPLPKAKERQNDFGGTFSGPIFKDRTFFFFSYEGLRLRLPQTQLTLVPDLSARQSAVPALQPFLNAFPKPNGPDNLATGVAQFNSSFSDPANLDASSIRIDHRVSSGITLFGRYNYSPSETIQRGSFGVLSQLEQIRITTQTATAGSTWAIAPHIVNDLRLNYSRVDSSSAFRLDNFGGAVPLTSLGFPSPFTTKNANLIFFILPLGGDLPLGKNLANLQRQINIVDDLSLQKAAHSLKFGIDFRRLAPIRDPADYVQEVFFSDVPSAEAGNLLFGAVISSLKVPVLLRNLGAFAQDTWRVVPRLTITYGLRWDLDFAPSTTSGPSFPAATGFNLANLSNLGLAPAGASAFKTRYGNVAPRVGVAYQIFQNPKWRAVLRGGFGVFYDLASEQAGNIFQGSYPFGGFSIVSGQFPLNAASATPPPITPSNLATGFLAAFDPNLHSPYTREWNVALEQGFGQQQTLSASYIGAAGRHLIATAVVNAPNPNIGIAHLITNAGTSDYHALQVQFKRRLSHGLQALASYTWSHSIDDGSAASYANGRNDVVPGLGSNANRGPSDFDIRNEFSAGLTYDIPSLKNTGLIHALLSSWSLENAIQARSAPPVDISDGNFSQVKVFMTDVRPDLLPGIPLFLHGPQYPGGTAINNTPGAVAGGCPGGSQSVGPFCPPPIDPTTGIPLRQGDLGRNALRTFGAAQWDFAIHREFPIHESVKIQFRAEMFNVLNHPNFGPPVSDISSLNFGRSFQMLGRSLDIGSAGAGLSSLYQLGGPRSIQFALKLTF